MFPNFFRRCLKIKPVIGISCGQHLSKNETYLPNDYVAAVWESNGMPFLIPVGTAEWGQEALAACHGLLLSGGGDLDPTLYTGDTPVINQQDLDYQRDFFEIRLVREALNQKKPVLAICRGLQVLNVALGGSLYQDLANDLKLVLKHRPGPVGGRVWHQVYFEPNTRMNQLFGDVYRVNSFHHQAVHTLGSNLIISGRSSDGVIEAIEYSGAEWLVGVQWHPERQRQETPMKDLFNALILEAQRQPLTKRCALC